jgi:acyl-coenzyme A thioesterase PaaI-like protein
MDTRDTMGTMGTMESWRTRLLRWPFNLSPAYRGTGGRVVHIDRDFREVRIRLPLNWRTRNYVGTTFGGSMYGAVDPVYMVMLRERLGRDYVVWDKAASIRFRKPGRATLHASFRLDDEEIQAIRGALATQGSVDRVYHVELADADGVVHATVEKTLHVRRRDAAAPRGERRPAASAAVPPT